ncbi:MAG: aspartyl/glutamyl-tRNA amidotransferase subunit B [Ignavibacteria bacterium RBG_16_34_14]|nr:MAG: aspartyl/glutamyl-tRNA amidotransferase subunit B [Ignavibacteria bacterium RBG_16_34_14]
MNLLSEKYEAVIGLEVHAQLLTESKIFCGCSTKFGNPPNTNVCPICLGYPGVLPVLNKNAVEYTLLMGLATNCKINERSVFARKNYFYPDLPKGYQISQYELPLCEDGFLLIDSDELYNSELKKRIGIKRIHLEEDAGKSIHDIGFETRVDLNRCGVPLIEIVSEPDIRSAREASFYLNEVRQIVQYLEICDGNMEEGSLRCDANVSVRLIGTEKFGTKTELKNMNSFRNVERAINHEIERQTNILEEGGVIFQETLLWNADLNEAFSMRSKEEAHDYRYFPEPDLLPVIVKEDWKNQISKKLPELPDAKKRRFISKFSLPEYDSDILTQDKKIANYFEKVISFTNNYKAVSNWIMGEVLKIINEWKIEITSFPVSPENLGKLINLIDKGIISGKIAKDVFALMLVKNKDPEEIIIEKDLVQITNTSEIENVIEKILGSHQREVKQFLEGNEKVLGFLVGQIMKETKGKANPKIVNELLKEKLDSLKKN